MDKKGKVPGMRNPPPPPERKDLAERKQQVLLEELNILVLAIEKGNHMGCYNPIELKAINSSVEVISEQFSMIN